MLVLNQIITYFIWCTNNSTHILKHYKRLVELLLAWIYVGSSVVHLAIHAVLFSFISESTCMWLIFRRQAIEIKSWVHLIIINCYWCMNVYVLFWYVDIIIDYILLTVIINVIIHLIRNWFYYKNYGYIVYKYVVCTIVERGPYKGLHCCSEWFIN